MNHSTESTTTDAQDILSGRLAQAQGILSSLLIDEQHNNMVSQDLNNTLWAIDTLLDQAAGALKEMPYVSKPDAPAKSQDTVTFDHGVTVNFKKEALSVVEEMVGKTHHATCVGQALLDAVAKTDKTA